jgi:hypothetical protein
MRSLGLLSRPCGFSITEIFHLLRTKGTAWVNGLDGPPLLSKRRLHGSGWSLIDERPRLIGRPGSGSLHLGRRGLRANGRRWCGITVRWFRLLHRLDRHGRGGCRGARRGGFQGWPIGWNRRRRVGQRCRSDHLRLPLLREPGAINRLRRRLAGTIHRGRRLGCVDWRSRGPGALKPLSGFHHRASLHRRNGPGCGLCRDDRRCRSN